MKKRLTKSEKEERMKKFHFTIQEIMDKDKITALEAITHYCEENNIDTIDVVSLISPSMKQQMFLEAVNNRQIKDNELHLDI